MNLKIAIIVERADIILGGAERSVFELASALQVMGSEVDILAAKGRTNAKNIHLLCQSRPGKRVCYHTFAKEVKKFVKNKHYDIIHSVLPFDFAHVYQPRGGTYAESIVRNAASYQNKFVAAYKRMTAFANVRRTLLLRAEKALCQNPDGPLIIAISDYVAEQLKSHYGLNASRIAVIPNGVKIDKRIDPTQTDKLRTQIFNQLRITGTEKPVLLLFVANNFRLKGLGPLITAMQSATSDMKANGPYLIVAGRGKSHKYRRLAKNLGVAGRIIFLGSVRHIQNALSIVDVAVLPTFYDPSSRFVLEAIAANKPVITTKYNGAADSFIDNRHGKAIDKPEDVRALAHAISYFTNRENIQKASRAITKDNLKERISIDRVAKQLISVYKSFQESPSKRDMRQ